MKKSSWIALVLICSMLTACGGGSELLVPAKVEPAGQGTESGALNDNDIASAPGFEPLHVTDETAVWEFSHRMLLENLNETNPVLSPVSAYLALGMVGLGAKGDTLAELEEAMGQSFPETDAGLMQAIPTWMQKPEDEKREPLVVANSVWVDETMNPENAWLERVNDIFAAEVYQGVLSGEGTKRDINKWVEKKTNSLIKEFLSEPLDIETKLALFNTIYFKGEWVSDFEKNDTYKEDFTTTDGKVKTVDMMHDYGRYEFYVKNDKVDGVVMDYRNGSMAMVMLKPTAGQTVREMYESLTYEELNALLDTDNTTNINLKLPKFEVEFDKKLNETLQNMGIKRAFDERNADFTGLGRTDNGIPLYISLVRQKAVVKLDEEGTEAAAVTMVAMNECASAETPEKPIEVFFDEPFLYMIMDMESRTPLFMGVMDDPSGSSPSTKELPRMIKLDGILYQDTGMTSHVLRCGVMDGEITSTVKEEEVPTENNQSNFGKGYGYQPGIVAGRIEVCMDDGWHIFSEEDVDWGITLSTREETSTGLKLLCTQEGGNATGRLQTGGYYILETLQDGVWTETDCMAEVAWTMEAYNLLPDNTAEWKIDWEWLYGELKPGIYRIGKEFMDFRDTGNYDSKMFYARFAIVD